MSGSGRVLTAGVAAEAKCSKASCTCDACSDTPIVCRLACTLARGALLLFGHGAAQHVAQLLHS